MGDKRKDARARAAGLRHMGEYNEGHIADLVQPGAADNGKDLILEVKLARCLKKSFNLGTGQSPASIGHIVAFGNTEAYYRALILGVKQRGRPGDAFSEDTGRGYVAYKEGDYHDAIYNKLNTVIPFILEVSGGATPHAYAFLKRLARDAKKMGSADGTKYTGSWTARSFLPHHAQRLAAAAVYGEAAAIATAINQLKQLATQRCTGPDRA